MTLQGDRTTDIQITHTRTAVSVRELRPEVVAAYVPRAYSDAEARARVEAIESWERLYGEPVPWASGRVISSVTHGLTEVAYEVRVLA